MIVKHANPCGVGVAANLGDAYDKAFATDPTSAFGGIIAFNEALSGPLLERILAQQFVEVVIAPSVDTAAVEVAKQKKNVRLLTCGDWTAGAANAGIREIKRVGGGLLVQDADTLCLDEGALRVVSKVPPTESQTNDLLFAWKVAWFLKSNAIVYARDLQTVGVGAGQMSRVVSAKIAGLKAAEEGLSVPGSVWHQTLFSVSRWD